MHARVHLARSAAAGPNFSVVTTTDTSSCADDTAQASATSTSDITNKEMLCTAGQLEVWRIALESKHRAIRLMQLRSVFKFQISLQILDHLTPQNTYRSNSYLSLYWRGRPT